MWRWWSLDPLQSPETYLISSRFASVLQSLKDMEWLRQWLVHAWPTTMTQRLVLSVAHLVASKSSWETSQKWDTTVLVKRAHQREKSASGVPQSWLATSKMKRRLMKHSTIDGYSVVMSVWSCLTVVLRSLIEQKISSSFLKESILPQKSWRMYMYSQDMWLKYGSTEIHSETTALDSLWWIQQRFRHTANRTVRISTWK